MDNFRIVLPQEEQLLKSEYNFEVLGNGVLYDMCKKHADHTVPEAIYAKLWLIGRSYSAALERNKSGEKTEVIYRNTVDELIKIGNRLDDTIRGLKPMVDNTSLYAALNVHKILVDIFYKTTLMEKRSLASKYLHFHRRDVFYIYDSYANTSLMNCVKGSVYSDSQYDSEYFKFCKKAVALKVKIKDRYSKDLDPREIDNLLIYLYKTKK